MTKTKSIERALQFIEENLKRRISLEDIADAANLSQWYFHRSFRILTGYCVNDYLRRRRISEASHELLYSSRAIIRIARDYQFESQEAFTRSFTGICGISPGRFRKMLSKVIMFPALSLDKSYQHLKKGAKMLSCRGLHRCYLIQSGRNRECCIERRYLTDYRSNCINKKIFEQYYSSF